MSNGNILISVSKPRVAQEMLRHLKEYFESVLIASEPGALLNLENLNVIIIDNQMDTTTRDLLSALKGVNHGCEIVLVSLSRDRKAIADIDGEFRLFRVISSSFSPATLVNSVHQACLRSRKLERVNALKQQISARELAVGKQRKVVRVKIQDRTLKLQEIRDDLTEVNMDLGLLGGMFGAIRRCGTLPEILTLLKKELKKVVVFDEVILGGVNDNDVVARVKKEYGSSVVFSLVAGGDSFGHLYFVSKGRGRFADIPGKLDVLSQASDMVAIALRKIKLLSTVDQKNRLWTALFNVINSPVVVIDKDFRVIRANNAYKTCFTDDGGNFCYKSFSGRASPCADCPVVKGDGRELVREVSRGDGRDYLVSAYPILTSGLTAVYYKEITDVRIYREQVESFRGFLDVAVLMQSVAQEVSRPVDEALGFLGGLLGNQEIEEFVQEDLNLLEASLGKAKAIISNILSLECSSRSAELINLSDLLVKIHSLMNKAAHTLGVKTEFRLSDRPLLVRGDYYQLFNLLFGLFISGIDFATSEQGGLSQIVVATDIVGDNVILRFLYAGVVVDDAVADANKDKFRQFDKVLSNHEATLELMAERDVGYVVILRLKLAEPVEKSTSPQPS